MANENNPLSLLQSALDQVSGLIDGLTPDQASLPTPCSSWDVARLVNHLIDDTSNFKVAAHGEMPDWRRPAGELAPDEWAPAFRAGAATLMDTWRVADPDALAPTPAGDQPLIRRADQQIAELAAHAWDLARASGQSDDLDPEVGAYALVWAQRSLRPEFRGSEEEGKAFGPEVPMSEDAPVYERLAAWFGRDPSWSPPRAVH
jgi:uncharacterized protein (TIGR03086 family)